MQHLINWIEIPATDIQRAIHFYAAVMQQEIQYVEMFGTHMGLFPNDGTHISGAIVQGDDYKPAQEGVVAYLNGGTDLQPFIDRVQEHHGIVIVPKTQISPEMGYFGMFIDTEGNKMAVHSI